MNPLGTKALFYSEKYIFAILTIRKQQICRKTIFGNWLLVAHRKRLKFNCVRLKNRSPFSTISMQVRLNLRTAIASFNE
jgi:hypothetical protein